MTRIMIVEDEPLVAADVGARVEALGYELGPTASTGQEALQLAREHHVDLAIMDIRLGGGEMDGIETAARLSRELDVPVVFVTAFADKQTLQRAVEIEPLGYLLKPFTDSEVTHVLETAVEKLQHRVERTEHEAWLEATFRGLSDAMLLLDDHGRVVLANSVAESFVGATRREIVGRPWTDVFAFVGPNANDAGALVTRARREGAAVSLPSGTSLRLPEGSEIPVEISAMPVLRPDRSPGSVAVVIRDVHEQRRLGDLLALSERLTALGSFAAGLAHEINNPLGAAMVAMELVGREVRRLRDVTQGAAPDPTKLVGAVSRAESAIASATAGLERIEAIMKDLSSFSRPGAERRPLDLARVLESAVRLVENQLTHRARLVRNIGSAPIVDGNEAQLVRAFVALLVNAAEASPEGQADRNTIRVSLHAADDGSALLEIEDTGTGLTPDLMVRMYEPFFTTKPVGAGMGLGLAIAQSVIAGHGGEIRARSEPGRGTTFTIRLPASPTQRIASVPPRVAAEPRRMRLLVVDDEPLIVSLLTASLAGAFDVTGATSAREALATLGRDARFDAILSDVVMPDIDGIALYEAVAREHPELASRFVFMTGGAFTPRTEQFLASMAGRYVLKPFRIDALEKALLEVGASSMAVAS